MAAPPLLKLGKPEKFDGNMNKTDTFITQCKLFLSNNEGIYDTNKKKVSYILSMMEGGTAGDWAQIRTEQYIGRPAQAGQPAVPPTWPGYDAFLTELIAAFTPADKQAEARGKLKGIRQKPRETATDYGARFKMLSNKSGITQDEALIDMYNDGLEENLRERMQSWDDFPNTLDAFMRKVEKLDQRLRRVSGAVAGLRTTHSVKQEPKENASLSKISTEERRKRFQQRQCYNCGRTGHFAADCRSRSQQAKSKPYFSKWKPKFQKREKGKHTAMKMRSLMAELDEDEQEECAKDLEEQGF
jgi:Zinc knuckle/Retrotransposon gag protein